MIDSGIKLANSYSKLKKLAGTNLGRNIIGHLAKPVFANLREIEHAKLEELEDEELKDPPNFTTQASELFSHNFAWGDVLSLVGLGMLTIQNKIFPAKSKQPGFIEKSFRSLSLGLTFGGSLSAMMGRMFDLHRKVVLGDKYAEAHLLAAERQGRKIFTQYDNQHINKLIKEAKDLDRLLVYPTGLKEMILERYAKDDIGGLFDGPPGTGKTAGVKCILGKWAERLIKEGKEPIIAELNLANFDEYLKEKNQAKADAMEAIQAGAGIEAGEEVLFQDNEGILVLELLVKKIQRLISQTKKQNYHSDKESQLAIFVDEFDKIFDASALRGCDKARLKNLLIQFNELFVDNNILLTSNTSLEDIVKEIKKHLQTTDNKNSGEEVWKPMYSRFSSKNRAFVDKPGSQEQAEIISARLLDDYRQYINWQDFGLEVNGSGNYELDRKQLAESIQKTIEELALKLDGRQLAYACDDIKTMLLGKARETRSLPESRITDPSWESLDADQKIQKTNVLIDKELIKKTLETKTASNKLETYDSDRDRVQSLLQSYFSTKEVKEKVKSIAPDNEINKVTLLNLLGEILDVREDNRSNEKTYIAKSSIRLDGTEHGFVIVRNEAGIHSKGSEPSFKFKIGKTGVKEAKIETTRDFALSELVSITNEVLNSITDDKNQALSGVLNIVKSAIKNPHNPDAFIRDLEKVISKS